MAQGIIENLTVFNCTKYILQYDITNWWEPGDNVLAQYENTTGDRENIDALVQDGYLVLAFPYQDGRLIVWRDNPRTNNYHLEVGEGLDPASLVYVLNQADRKLQEERTHRNRAIKVPPGETIGDLPTATRRAGKFLGFNSQGAPIMIDDPTGQIGDGERLDQIDVTLGDHESRLDGLETSASVIMTCSPAIMSIPADWDGGNPVLTLAIIQIALSRGNINITSGWTIAAVCSAGITGTFTSATVFQITGMTPVSGKITFEATYDAGGLSPIVGIVNVEKAMPGVEGSYRDYRFIRAATQPATPTGANPEGWEDAPVTGAWPLWITSAKKNHEGDLLSAWSEPTRIDGSFMVQYSVDGATSWHDTFTAGDLYARNSTDGGNAWTEAYRIVGETGTSGRRPSDQNLEGRWPLNDIPKFPQDSHGRTRFHDGFDYITGTSPTVEGFASAPLYANGGIAVTLESRKIKLVYTSAQIFRFSSIPIGASIFVLLRVSTPTGITVNLNNDNSTTARNETLAAGESRTLGFFMSSGSATFFDLEASTGTLYVEWFYAGEGFPGSSYYDQVINSSTPGASNWYGSGTQTLDATKLSWTGDSVRVDDATILGQLQAGDIIRLAISAPTPGNNNIRLWGKQNGTNYYLTSSSFYVNSTITILEAQIPEIPIGLFRLQIYITGGSIQYAEFIRGGVVYDTSGNNRPLIPWYAGRDGGILGNGAMLFGKARLRSMQFDLYPNGGLTMACWRKASGIQGSWWRTIMQFGLRDGNYDGFGVRYGYGNDLYILNAGATVRLTDRIDDTGWHHWAMVIEAAAAKLYIDGILYQVKTGTFSLAKISGFLRVGAEGASVKADATFDEPILYSRALDDEEILWLAKNPTSTPDYHQGVYLGPTATMPPTQAALPGDWILFTGTTANQYTKGKFYLYSGSGWSEDTNTDHQTAGMQDLMDLAAGAASGTFEIADLYAQRIVALNAFIQNLFAKDIQILTGGQIRSGYTAAGVAPASGLGFFLGSDGSFKAKDAILSGDIINSKISLSKDGVLKISTGSILSPVDGDRLITIYNGSIKFETYSSSSWRGGSELVLQTVTVDGNPVNILRIYFPKISFETQYRTDFGAVGFGGNQIVDSREGYYQRGAIFSFISGMTQLNTAANIGKKKVVIHGGISDLKCAFAMAWDLSSITIYGMRGSVNATEVVTNGDTAAVYCSIAI